MAEALLRDRLARRGVAARVRSAGLLSEGVAASAHSVRTMAERGLALDDHRSTPLTADAVAQADLVVGMAREHVREAAVLEGDALGRAFTLKELVRRAEIVGPRRAAANVPAPDARSAATSATNEASPSSDDGLEPFASWLQRVAVGRQGLDLLGANPADDVLDPIGRSRRTYARTAVEIEDLVDRFVALAFPVEAALTRATR